MGADVKISINMSKMRHNNHKALKWRTHVNEAILKHYVFAQINQKLTLLEGVLMGERSFIYGSCILTNTSCCAGRTLNENRGVFCA